MPHAAALGAALHGMTPIEGDDIEVAMNEVEARRLGPFDDHAPRAGVAHDRRARDDVRAGEHAVEKLDLEPEPLVAQGDRERLRPGCLAVGVHGGQPLEGVLAGADLMAVVAQVAPERPLGVAHHQKRAAHVARPLEGELLRQHVERVGALADVRGLPAHAAAVGVGEQIAHVAFAARPVVQVEQVSVLVDPHLVRRSIRVQREGPRAAVVDYRHLVLGFG